MCGISDSIFFSFYFKRLATCKKSLSIGVLNSLNYKDVRLRLLSIELLTSVIAGYEKPFSFPSSV